MKFGNDAIGDVILKQQYTTDLLLLSIILVNDLWNWVNTWRR